MRETTAERPKTHYNRRITGFFVSVGTAFMQPMTPEHFVQKWSSTNLGERQSYQLHFIDVCQLVGHAPPDQSGMDSGGKQFAFEYGAKKLGGGQGFADVFYEGHFGIEYKGINKHPDLNAAYTQLQLYRENLLNPPLLVVCDIANWEIHTNFTNTVPRVYRFGHRDILEPQTRRWLHNLFFAPELLRPDRDTVQVTQEAAESFRLIVDNMRNEWQTAPDRIAHFLTKLVFCLFAEDVGLLPTGARGERGIFSEIVEQTRHRPEMFQRTMHELFQAMADGGTVLYKDIPYFNGTLFDNVDVERLSLAALNELDKASHLDWSAVEPAIFGTLFERSLDLSKRSQLGAHYTSRNDILLIVEPVLMQPLRREWEAIKAEAAPIRQAYAGATTPRTRQNRLSELNALRETMLNRLRTIKVLDPACGSGNFLYVSLQLLMDMEKSVITDPLWADLPLAFPEVHPRQLYGIEINPIAHGLAGIVAWIGYIQWRENNGYHAWKEPILEPLTDHIVQMDAIIQYDAGGQPFEPDWPEADVIVGNPPFLGDKKMRAELGDKYVNQLRRLYEGRIPGGADFVTYWFEKARADIERKATERAGLLATNSIRQGANRTVLDRIKSTGDIFMAWSDREWILEGAAVRVSMIGFDDGAEVEKALDGITAPIIHSDLSSTVDVTLAQAITENKDLCFLGVMKGGPFDIDTATAQRMLDDANNPNGNRNTNVVRRRMNGQDVTARWSGGWVIDFGTATEEEASAYRLPYDYVVTHVKPLRDVNRDNGLRTSWWLHGRYRPAMRAAIANLSRYIVTPEVSKHRLFVWADHDMLPDHKLHVISRSDDYFFGVLHSKLHELWSLRLGSWLGVGNDPSYSSSRTFETFPFPWPPGKEDTSSPAYAAISAAAKTLHEERDAWLNPPGLSEVRLQKRTLTNLYNALLAFRGTAERKVKIEADAGDFAPRLDVLHEALDRAVCDAYGWPHDILTDEEAMLTRLLALNLERAAAQSTQ